MHSRPHRKLSLLALGGTLAFLGCLLALHILSFGRPPEHMSDFARTQYGLIFFAGAYAFVLAVVSAMLCLRRTLPRGWSSQAGIGLLLLAVPFGLLVATFPVDETGVDTLSGDVHQFSVFPLFFFVTAAMLVLVPGLRAHEQWRPLANYTLALGLLAAMAQTAYQLSELWLSELAVGITQRIMVAAILAWFLGVAVVMRRWPSEVTEPVPAPAPPEAAPVAAEPKKP
jgi:hypothetical membrane protein